MSLRLTLTSAETLSKSIRAFVSETLIVSVAAEVPNKSPAVVEVAERVPPLNVRRVVPTATPASPKVITPFPESVAPVLTTKLPAPTAAAMVTVPPVRRSVPPLLRV